MAASAGSLYARGRVAGEPLRPVKRELSPADSPGGDGEGGEEARAGVVRRRLRRKSTCAEAGLASTRSGEAASEEAKVGQAAAEDFARQAVESGLVCQASVVKALSLAPVPLQARQNVIPVGQKSVRGMVCGLYVYGDRIALTTATSRLPWLSRLLSEFGRRANPGFAFTSIQVNLDYAARLHVDRNNLGPSLIIGLGRYTGGELWIHDDAGDKTMRLEEDIAQERLYRKGTSWRGVDVDIHGKWFEFNGNKLHCTRPFEGKRFTLVYFTVDRYAETPAESRKAMAKAGFSFDWGSAALKRMLAEKTRERKELRDVFEREARHGRKVGLLLLDDDKIRYEQDNPKQSGSQAHKLYSKYLSARTIREARELGARSVDFQYDLNWGYLQVVLLHPRPAKWDFDVKDTAWSSTSKADVALTGLASGKGAVPVRVKELVDSQPGMPVPRAALSQLAARCEPLRALPEARWSAEDGPLATLPLGALRSALDWAVTGRLRAQAAHAAALCEALRAWSQPGLAEVLAGVADVGTT